MRALAEALEHGEGVSELVAPGIAGSCPNCGALLSTDSQFCPRCGSATGPGSTAEHGPPEESRQSAPDEPPVNNPGRDSGANGAGEVRLEEGEAAERELPAEDPAAVDEGAAHAAGDGEPPMVEYQLEGSASGSSPREAGRRWPWRRRDRG